MKKHKGLLKFDVFLTAFYILIVLYVLSMLFLLLFGVLNSVKDTVDFDIMNNIFGLPSKKRGWQFGNYIRIFNEFKVSVKAQGEAPRPVYIEEMFLNSLLYSALMSIFCIATQVMVSYTIARFDTKLGKIIYTVAIIVMLVPIVGSLPSQVRFAQLFNLNNSLIGICIMNCKYPGIYFLVFYATFKSLPSAYSEAAQLDGASYWRVFLQIYLPMITSTLSAVFILYFITYWNEYQLPMLFLPLKPTVAYGLYMYQSNVDTSMSTPIKLAAAISTCIPVILLFVIFRNKIMGNVTIGGIKG